MIKKADGHRNADIELKDISEGSAAFPSAVSDGSVCLGCPWRPVDAQTHASDKKLIKQPWSSYSQRAYTHTNRTARHTYTL